MLIAFMIIGILAVTIMPALINSKIQKFQASFMTKPDIYQQSDDQPLTGSDQNNDMSSSTSQNLYTSTGKASAFQIDLPANWKFVKRTTNATPKIDMISTFSSANGQSVISIAKLNMPDVRSSMASSTDNDILQALAQGGVISVKHEFTSMGLKGFQVSDLEKQTFGSDNAYVYRGSAAFGAPDYSIIDFNLITIFNGNHGYQILAIWPESEYGWSAKAIFDSLATFRIND